MKIYKISMNKSHPSVRQALVDREDMHSNIQQMFNCDRAGGNILYRINKSEIYVSATKDIEVSEKNGMTVVKEHEIRKYNAGEKLRFNVFTMPYKKISGKRIPLINNEERMDWLTRMGGKHGFRVLAAKENGFGSVDAAKKNLHLTGYYYVGALEVTDSEKFNEAIKKGIGGSKAYGLGMLMVV